MTKGSNKLCTLVLAMILAATTASWSHSAEQEREVQFLTPFFTAPISIEGFPASEDRGPVLADVARPNREPTIFLAKQSPDAGLLVGATRAGFGMPIRLPIKTYVPTIARGAGDVLWVGGVRGGRVSIDSVPRSYGYLAKVDRQGHLFWERDYGEKTQRSIESIAPLPSDGVVISGKDDDRTWLAKIADDGSIVWERFIGIGKGSAVTTADGIIVLAALEACQCDGNYREDVAVWSFDQTGRSLDHQIVREGINLVQTQSAAEVQIDKMNDAIYILSAWIGFEAKPFQVVRMNSRRELLWSKEFPKTVWYHGNRANSYLPSHGLLSSGDILFTTSQESAKNEFVLSRLDAASGEQSEVVIRLPAAPPAPCVGRWGPIILMKDEPQNMVLLFGSPPELQGQRACGWIGEAVMPKSRQ